MGREHDNISKLTLDILDVDASSELSLEELAEVLEAEAQIECGEFVEGTPTEFVAAAFDHSRK